MKIGINLLFLKPGLAGGTETYTNGLLRGLADIDRDKNSYIIFCCSTFNYEFLNGNHKFKIVQFNRVSRSLPYRFFFEQVIFPFHLIKYKVNVLHSFGYIGPVFEKNHVVTIHDTNAFVHKSAMPYGKRILLSFFLKVIAKTSKHIITVSHFSKQEIIKNLNAKPEKISVIFEACKFEHTIDSKPLPPEYAFLAHTKYIVALTSVSPHKNIPLLVEAFNLAAKKINDIKLILIGHMPADNNIQNAVNSNGLQDKVLITGFVTDEVLDALLKNAYCFVFPSLYEGFGLPLLEAQSVGLPVIASTNGSLPEIGGDSVIYFNGQDAGMLAEKLIEVLTDKTLAPKYSALGLENVKRFSWVTAAKETIKIYEACKN